ncbi:putative endoglucanase [Xylariales sp. PMI_506]|nr:putative endoglucanase [Xylariales sp. PMI_506]
MRFITFLSALAGTATAQIGAYQQCGGITYTGSTTCISGYYCEYLNDYFSYCVPGTATTTVTSTSTSTSSPTQTSSTTAPSATGFKWFGVDESVAEWGTAIPGTWGIDFYFPDTTTIGQLIGEGYNIFRIPFMMERMIPTTLTGTPDAGYLANMTTVVNYVTSLGAYAVLDAHNYGRYYGNIINDTSGFQTFWNTLATQFASNSLVIFDTNNEYHDMDQTLVLDLNQAAINGIREAGATSQYIFVEGNAWTGAWYWNVTNNNLATLTDPEDKIVYEMHQYLDTDGSGSPETCVSDTIGVERVEGATAWLREYGKLGVLGEFAGGPDDTCLAAITGMLDHMEANSDVWLGAVWWSAGPWWGNYTTYNFEPPSGAAYEYYDSTLVQYTPSHYSRRRV